MYEKDKERYEKEVSTYKPTTTDPMEEGKITTEKEVSLNPPDEL